MQNTIFYSWQSDLPNNQNRGFIESCINTAIKKLKDQKPFSIEMSIDRDTKGETGTPSITESIFKKIDNSKLFIADVSIINSNYEGKKSPNPNVLLELGYAARSIGWEKVICIYNTSFGTIEDLPFDLRHRRPILYNFNNDTKSNVRNYISDLIVDSITDLNDKGLLDNITQDYLKVQVDTELLSIINNLNKIVNGYNESNDLKNFTEFLSLGKDEINKKLLSNRFIGFQILKSWKVYQQKLKVIADSAVSSNHYSKEIIVLIISLKKWIDSFENFNNPRNAQGLFIESDEMSMNYEIAHNKRIKDAGEYPDRYFLIDKTGNSRSEIKDFGDFQERKKINNLTKFYTINKDYVDMYNSKIVEFNRICLKWLDLTNGEIIVDNIQTFELKPNPVVKVYSI